MWAMIGGILDFVSGINPSTAIISVIVGFVLKAVWDVLTSNLRRRRQDIRDEIGWYRELRALARQIVIATSVTRFNSKMPEDAGDELLDRYKNNVDGEIDHKVTDIIDELVEEKKDSVSKRQETRMESLYEELLNHLSTRDIELEDGVLGEVLDLFYFTHMMSPRQVDLSELEKTPAEESGERVAAICNLRIDELKSELSIWGAFVSRIKNKLPSRST
jgi:F0F1-type ATP synthase membrane subunit b/b'